MTVVQRRRVRARLRQGPLAPAQVPGLDVAACVEELRKLGWIIQSGPGEAYTLLSEPLDAELVISLPTAKVARLKAPPQPAPRRRLAGEQPMFKETP